MFLSDDDEEDDEDEENPITEHLDQSSNMLDIKNDKGLLSKFSFVISLLKLLIFEERRKCS